MLVANGEVFYEICKDRIVAINGDSKVVVSYKDDKVVASIKNGVLTIKSKETGKIVKSISPNYDEVCIDAILEERKPAKVKYKSSSGGSISCDGDLIGNNCRIKIKSYNKNFSLYSCINLGSVTYGSRDTEEKVSSLGNLNNILKKDVEKVSSQNRKLDEGKPVRVVNKRIKIKNVNGQHIDLGVRVSSISDLEKEGPIVVDNSGKKINGKKSR